MTEATLGTGLAASVFALTFLFGGHLQPFRALVPDHRAVVSWAGGMSMAYVFVHVMPELGEMRPALASDLLPILAPEGLAIYFVALLGFLVFYGLDRLHGWLKVASSEEGGAFSVHVGGFTMYATLIGYLLVHRLDEGSGSTALYTLALSLHLLTIAHHLREEHGDAWDHRARFILGAAPLLGWGLALLYALPPNLLALSMALVSGGVIVNSALLELPSEKDGRFVPFAAGALLYGLLLLPLG